MRIAVGSKNKPKLEAVREIVKEYDFFAGAEVVGISVVSGVREQPVGLDETVQGAINRAKSAFHNCQYAIGLESGIIPVPQTKSGYMDLTVCAIYDGATIHLGMSSAFEYPPQMVKMALEDGIDISTSARMLGITTHEKIGEAEGMIGFLTKSRLTRKDYTIQALRTALIHLENRGLY